MTYNDCVNAEVGHLILKKYDYKGDFKVCSTTFNFNIDRKFKRCYQNFSEHSRS